MKCKFKNIIFLLILGGCNSTNNISQKDFVFSTESFSYQWSKSIYNSESNEYVRKTYSDPDKNVNISLSKIEKDSLNSISRRNFCQCIKNYNEDLKVFYVSRINKLVYKGIADLKQCDTINADSNLIDTPEFIYYTKFRQIVNSKSNYQDAFPEEFVIY